MQDHRPAKQDQGHLAAHGTVLASALVVCAPLVAQAATSHPTPGFNVFSVEQGIEIGRQSAVAAEGQPPMLNDRNLDRYLNRIVTKLAAQAPGGPGESLRSFDRSSMRPPAFEGWWRDLSASCSR